MSQITPLNIADMIFSTLGENVTQNVPTYNITGGTISGGNNTLTIGNHTLKAGQTVYISGVSPTDWNGYFTIASVSSTTITFPVTYSDAYVSGGTVTWAYPYDGTAQATKFNAVWNSQILNPTLFRAAWNALKIRTVLVQPSFTITAGTLASQTETLTIGVHSLLVGQTVTVTGIVDSVSNDASWNGTFPITAVTGTTISFVNPNATGTYSSGGSLTYAPVFGWNYIYKLPADCLRALKVNELSVDTYFQYVAWNYLPIGNIQPPFKIENGYLLSNESSVDLLYLQLQNPPQDYILVDLLVAKGAADLAFTISHDNNMAGEFMQKYRTKLTEAMLVNSQTGTPDEFQEDSWITARY